MIYNGTIIETNRGRTIRYKVVGIIRNCNCPDPIDWFNGREEKLTKPHYHLELKQIYPVECGMNVEAGINWVEFKNNKWKSIFDRLNGVREFTVVSHPKSVQLEMFEI